MLGMQEANGTETNASGNMAGCVMKQGNHMTNALDLLVLQSAVYVMALKSYSHVVQGIALMASTKFSIIMCAVGHDLRHNILRGHKCFHSGSNAASLDWHLPRRH